jgi:murein DD-endopeptidase MepM/ murein hydrolase activator NlpD
MKFLNSLKKIKNFFILIVPDYSSADSKSRRVTFRKAAAILGGYTIIIAVAGYIFFSLTPLGDLINPSHKGLSTKELQKIEELNSRMLFLSKELESLKSTNEKLKYAIMLGDSSLLESLTVKYDTSGLKKKAGGSIYAVVKSLLQLTEVPQSENYYFLKPVDGFISREFNPDKGHLGIDYVVKTGTPVFSAAGGYVVFSDYISQDGYVIIISHPDNYITLYKHCSALLKKAREVVQQGELIALSGNSGEITTGPHLHFEIWLNGQPQNPKTLLFKQ